MRGKRRGIESDYFGHFYGEGFGGLSDATGSISVEGHVSIADKSIRRVCVFNYNENG